ncbi:MAG: aldehyde reductase [Lentisphaerae bacterium GWF2_45_14]|nr:MAG: aldehyde reductase [Lentisphaerae bacterium GWF2_45_14]
MDNFSYWNPVRTAFGKGSVSQLPNLLPREAKIMIVYGGGSIKKNGVYNQVVSALKGRQFSEFGGIGPNPLYETCIEAVNKVREEKVNFLLAVGGGSVIDAVKFIAAASPFKGEPWSILSEPGIMLNSAIPFGCVLTLPATGSEMNANSVISRASTMEKLHFSSPLVYPRFSVMDPEFTFSLPPRQVANGIIDTFVHVMEQYMTIVNNAPLQDRQAEAVINTLIEEAPRVVAEPKNYDVRANLMWAASNGLNGLLACGQKEDWATHMIGHELTAFYGIDHARSLAVILPALWRYKRKDKHDKLIQYARRIFAIQSDNEERAIDEAINRTEDFFNSLDVSTHLADYGINASEAASKIRDRFDQRSVAFGENADIDGAAAYEIIMTCA